MGGGCLLGLFRFGCFGVLWRFDSGWVCLRLCCLDCLGCAALNRLVFVFIWVDASDWVSDFVGFYCGFGFDLRTCLVECDCY